MPKFVKVSETWRQVVQIFVKVGTTGGPFNNGWRAVQQGFVKVGEIWKTFFAGAITPGTVTLTRSSANHPSTLTGSTTYWDGITSLTSVFKSAITQTGTYSNIGTPTTITNPLSGGSTDTRTYAPPKESFSYTTPTLWYIYSVTGTDGTNTTTVDSSAVSVTYPKPLGEAGSVTFSRNSNDSYVYSVITQGNWTGSPTSYRYQWQYYNGLVWVDIAGATSSTFDANASYTNLTDPKLDTIRPAVWASNNSGESDGPIFPAAGLFVHYRKPTVSQFSVTGGTGFISYSYTEAAHNIDPGRTVSISYSGASTGSFTPGATSGTFPTSGSLTGGTYTFTITVTNSSTNGASLASDAVSVSNVVVSGLTAGSITVSPSSGEATGSNRVTIGSTISVTRGTGWSSGLTYTQSWSFSRDQSGVGPNVLGTGTSVVVPTFYNVGGVTFYTVGEWISVTVTGTNAGGSSVSTTLLSRIVPPAPTFSLTNNQNSTFTISNVSSTMATYYKGTWGTNGTVPQTAIASNATINSGAGTFNVSLIAGATDFNSIARESFTSTTNSVTVNSLTEPTITFNNQSATYSSGGSYTLQYSSNSAGAVTFSCSDTTVATVSGSTLNFTSNFTTNPGNRTATITLNQAASGIYAAATRTMTFTLNPGTALVPTFETPARSATGWVSSVLGGYSYDVEPWSLWTRTATFSSSPTTPTPTTSWNDADGLIAVSGLAEGQVTTFTLTLTRGGYQTGSGSVSASRCEPPTNTASPTLSGSFVNGGSVTSTTGTWTGATSYLYQFELGVGSSWEAFQAYSSLNSFTIPSNATSLGYTKVRSLVRAGSSCGSFTVFGSVSPEYTIGAGTPPPTTPPRTPPPTTAPPRTPPPTTAPPRTPPPTTSPTVPPRTPPTTPPRTPPPTVPPRTPPTTPPRTPPTTPPRTPPPTTPPRTPPIAPPGILTPI